MSDNKMSLEFVSKPENEAFARVAVAAFVSQLDPTIDELSDVKTAVSEAVTNCIIHGYDNKQDELIKIETEIFGNEVVISISDNGKGIENIKQAMEPLYTSRPDLERSGMGFTVMETFMDELNVESEKGNGTRVVIKKKFNLVSQVKDMRNENVTREVYNYDNNPELLSKARDGDSDAMNKLIEMNLPLVMSISKKFLNRGYEYEDIFQIGSIGLVKAINNFDLNYNVKFSTYAVPMIIGEIKRFLRDDGMIKVSRNVKSLARKINIYKEELSKKLKRVPSIEELAEYAEVEKEEIVFAIESSNNLQYLYDTIHQDDGAPILLIDKLTEEKKCDDNLIEKIALKEALRSLDEKARQIIMLRYFKDKTQIQVAKMLGISQVQVSRIEKKVLSQMKRKLEEQLILKVALPLFFMQKKEKYNTCLLYTSPSPRDLSTSRMPSSA
eukprot:TRINITY_DN5802_c0_g1_i10.p1 TRINITY_DN5802_c0_g1~~TRINITY_DN5802_c0_g1_i10.p1  ORF type:complete len:441 (+),score=78.14 TRINITY_DN5802_c0_g1_i10:586-1908(+)